MSNSRRNLKAEDRALGLGQPISRRDFLNSTLIASGALLTSGVSPAQLLSQEDWTGYGGVGDYSSSNGNTYSIVQSGHGIRNGDFETLPAKVIDTGETYDCVIVGGGISGLAAALFFMRQSGSGSKCLVLDNHPIFGGEAKRNEFMVDGQRLIAHQGSAVFFQQYPHSFLARFYESIGLSSPKLEYQTWGGTDSALPLSRTPYDMVGSEPASYGFYFGAKFGQRPGVWWTDPWGKKLQGAPISDALRAELLKWRAGPQKPDPRPKYEGDEVSRRLDGITLEDHMVDLYGISRETIRTFLSPVEGGGSGLGPDVLSAYADYAADLLRPLESDDTDQMFPGGNTGIARLMVKTLIPDSISGANTLEDVSRGKVNFGLLD
ncbi:MAG: FAD-dependent oxidoreductase, partial [Acidobacteria bacterium]